MNPPLISPQTPNQTRSFAHQAALGGLAAPILAIVVNVVARQAVGESGFGKLIVGEVAATLILTGLVLSIIALCGIARHGPRGLLGRGIAGLVINGLLVAAFVFGFATGLRNRLKNRQAQEEIQSTAQAAQQDLKNSFDPKNGITNFNPKAAERMKAQLEAASKTLSGDEALAAKASAAYLGRMQSASEDMQKAMQQMEAAQILDFSNVTAREQLQARRAAVQNFASENQKLLYVITNSPTAFREDLESQHANAITRERLVAGFVAGVKSREVLLIQIRQSDARSAKAMLDALNLLETNWGKWEVDKTSKSLKFTTDELVAEYNGIVMEMQAAAEVQLRAQRQLVNVKDR